MTKLKNVNLLIMQELMGSFVIMDLLIYTNGCYWTRSPYDSSASDVSIVYSNGVLAWSMVANDSSCSVRLAFQSKFNCL